MAVILFRLICLRTIHRELKRALILPAVLTLAAALPTSAPAESDGAEPIRVARAVRLNGQPVELDGALDEAAWNDAVFTTGFIQKDPNEGEPAKERTEVAFLYDEDAIYVGAKLFKESTDEIRATVSRRDNAGNSERLIVTLDTYHDPRGFETLRPVRFRSLHRRAFGGDRERVRRDL